MLLEVRNMSKSFGSLKVLENINLSVDKGDVICVLGPSGSGKTTLLRCMNFLEEAEKGTIEFEGDEYIFNLITKKEIREIRKKTGFVFQNYNLFENKTALENVIEGLIVGRKIPKEKAIALGRKALDKVGLSQKYNYYPRQLSGGQQQRVGIARAIVTEPAIIYFDEPTSALDPEWIQEVLKVIKQLADEGMTMIIVTHEMNFAKRVSNRIIFMDHGQILEQRNPIDFFETPHHERTIQFLKSMESTMW